MFSEAVTRVANVVSMSVCHVSVVRRRRQTGFSRDINLNKKWGSPFRLPFPFPFPSSPPPLPYLPPSLPRSSSPPSLPSPPLRSRPHIVGSEGALKIPQLKSRRALRY